MLIAIYNIRPKDGYYISSYMLDRQFVLDVDRHHDFFGWEFVNFDNFYGLLDKLIVSLLEKKGYCFKDAYEYDRTEVIEEDGKYVVTTNPTQFFSDLEPIDKKTTKEQMDSIYKDISPVISMMNEIYPNAVAFPVYSFIPNPDTKETKVKLVELKFTMRD